VGNLPPRNEIALPKGSKETNTEGIINDRKKKARKRVGKSRKLRRMQTREGKKKGEGSRGERSDSERVSRNLEARDF